MLSAAFVSLLWLHPRLHGHSHAWFGDRVSGGSFRCRSDTQERPGGAMHRSIRCPYYVQCRARADTEWHRINARVRIFADWYCSGLEHTRRTHAQAPQDAELDRTDYLLWYDRNQSRLRYDDHRRPFRKAHQQRRKTTPTRGSKGCRSFGLEKDSPDRYERRTRSEWLPRHARLLGRSEKDNGSARA